MQPRPYWVSLAWDQPGCQNLKTFADQVDDFHTIIVGIHGIHMVSIWHPVSTYGMRMVSTVSTRYPGYPVFVSNVVGLCLCMPDVIKDCPTGNTHLTGVAADCCTGKQLGL